MTHSLKSGRRSPNDALASGIDSKERSSNLVECIVCDDGQAFWGDINAVSKARTGETQGRTSQDKVDKVNTLCNLLQSLDQPGGQPRYQATEGHSKRLEAQDDAAFSRCSRCGKHSWAVMAVQSWITVCQQTSPGAPLQLKKVVGDEIFMDSQGV